MHAHIIRPGMILMKISGEKLCILVKKNGLFVVMDMAYLGFASGDIKTDLTAVRLLNELKHPSFICTSFSKNLSLYGERIGNLFYYNDAMDESDMLLKTLIRRSYSNPPVNGAKIISKILKTPDMRYSWEQDLKYINEDYTNKREMLKNKLENTLNEDFSDITKQRGMFYFSKITMEQNAKFQEKGIFFPGNRISLAGLNDDNIDHFVNTWSSVIKS